MNQETNLKLEKYLPIGTVVMLKEGKKRMMIIGYCSIDEGNKEKIFDYTGCLYPEGLLSSDQFLLFDHAQIEKIYHVGLVDEEQQVFVEKLKEAVRNNEQNI